MHHAGKKDAHYKKIERPTSYPLEGFGYRLLDAGDFKKLEQFGPHRFIRPSPPAIWPSRLEPEEWKQAKGEYTYFKGKESGGEWKFFGQFPREGWTIPFRHLTFLIRPTGFGHVGLFPEQAENWIWIEETLKRFARPGIQVLNMFGYTGASTLAAASAGAQVTHVDASKASVTWARQNLELSGLGDRPVRWIVDDAVKFLKREHARGRRYDALIMDPPTFGRGPKGEVWKIEKSLAELLIQCKKILTDKPLLFLLTTHSPGFSALTMENMILTYLAGPESGTIESGEMAIHDVTSGLNVPNGFYSRWTAR